MSLCSDGKYPQALSFRLHTEWEEAPEDAQKPLNTIKMQENGVSMDIEKEALQNGACPEKVTENGFHHPDIKCETVYLGKISYRYFTSQFYFTMLEMSLTISAQYTAQRSEDIVPFCKLY